MDEFFTFKLQKRVMTHTTTSFYTKDFEYNTETVIIHKLKYLTL